MEKEIHFTSSIKFFFVLAVGLYLLPACAKTQERNADSTALPIEADAFETDFEYQFVAESENGYYIWERLNQDQFYPRLMFIDKVSGRVVPLCNKPDCMHEGEECNAYFPEKDFGADGVDKQYLQYYEGNLYAVGLSADDYVVLFRIKTDGSEWEICARLYRTDYISTGHWLQPEILISEGYVYFVDEKQKNQRLERIPINGGASEVVFEGNRDASEVRIFRLECRGDNLYFQAHDFWEGTSENALGGLYQYNMVTGHCDLIEEGLTSPYSVQGDFVYYGSAEGLCRYSMCNHDVETLVSKPMDVPNITLTKDYIILCDQMADHSLTIYDYEGNEIGTVPNNLGLRWYFGGSSDRLFGEFADDVGWKRCFLDLTRPLAELGWEELKAE